MGEKKVYESKPEDWQCFHKGKAAEKSEKCCKKEGEYNNNNNNNNNNLQSISPAFLEQPLGHQSFAKKYKYKL